MTAIGLIGFGRWGKLIFRDLRTLGATVHVAVRSPASQAAAHAAGASSVCQDLRDLPGVDGFVVATPTSLHAETIERLIPQGRPIFVEKPLTSDLNSARRLAELAPERIFVMDKWRYHPGVEALGAQVRSGALGDILAVRTYRLGWDNPHRDVDAMWILMPHDLSIAYEILGFLPAARAAFVTIPGRGYSNLIAILENPDGGPQVIAEISANHPTSRRAVVVVGTKGSAQLADSYDDRILVADGTPGLDAAPPRQIAVGDAMPLQRELAAFIAHLNGGPPPRSSAAEGLLVVERITSLRSLAGLDQP